jgi:hypothetical protein
MTPTPMFLIDGWPDGYIEEKAWVEVTTLIDSKEKAIEFLENEMPIEDMFPDEPKGHLHYRVVGQEWQRRVGLPVPDTDARVERPLDEYGPCHSCNGTGTYEVIEKIEQTAPRPALDADAATRLGSPPTVAWMVGMPVSPRNEEKIRSVGGVITKRRDAECEDCHGTGKEADWITGDEGWPYEACEEGSDEAMLFWKLEVSDEPDPAVNVSDEQTTLPET